MTAASNNKNPGSDSVPKAIKNSEQLRRGGGTLAAFQLWRKKGKFPNYGKGEGVKKPLEEEWGCGECDPTSNCNNVRRKALRFNMGERGGGEKNRLWAAHITALQKEGEKGGGGGEIMPHKSSAKWVLGGGKSRGRRSTYDLIVWGFLCSLSLSRENNYV